MYARHTFHVLSGHFPHAGELTNPGPTRVQQDSTRMSCDTDGASLTTSYRDTEL